MLWHNIITKLCQIHLWKDELEGQFEMVYLSHLNMYDKKKLFVPQSPLIASFQYLNSNFPFLQSEEQLLHSKRHFIAQIYLCISIILIIMCEVVFLHVSIYAPTADISIQSLGILSMVPTKCKRNDVCRGKSKAKFWLQWLQSGWLAWILEQ